MVHPDRIRQRLASKLEGLYALARYPFVKHDLLTRLSRAMPGVDIETTNICNANCVFCAYQYQQRPTGIMSMDLFRKVIDEFVEVGGGFVNFTPAVGDPLVDPFILDRIQYARRAAAVTNIEMYTNMIGLDRYGAAALANSGLSTLTVSTSGFDAQMYARIYRSREYPRVLRNIIAFAEANEAAGRPVELSIHMRVDRPPSEVFRGPDYGRVASIVGAERIVTKTSPYHNFGGRITQDQLPGTMRVSGKPPAHILRISPCANLYVGGPTVYWDGRVVACGCLDIDAGELYIGDAKTSHIADIWLGEEIRRIRDEFLTPKIRPICASCALYQNLSIVLRRSNAAFVRSIKPVSRADRD